MASEVRRVPTYCYQCVAGPDLLTVKVQDGVATPVHGNPDRPNTNSVLCAEVSR